MTGLFESAACGFEVIRYSVQSANIYHRVAARESAFGFEKEASGDGGRLSDLKLVKTFLDSDLFAENKLKKFPQFQIDRT